MAELPKELVIKRRERAKGALAQDIADTAAWLASKAQTGEFTTGAYVATMRHHAELVSEYQKAYIKQIPAGDGSPEPMTDAEAVVTVATDNSWMGVQSNR